MPSMSGGVSPASLIAASAAWVASVRSLRPESREKSVAPIPTDRATVAVVERLVVARQAVGDRREGGGHAPAWACSAWVSSTQPISMILSAIFHVPSTLRSVSW